MGILPLLLMEMARLGAVSKCREPNYAVAMEAETVIGGYRAGNLFLARWW